MWDQQLLRTVRMVTALERVTVRTRSQALGPLQALPSKGLALSFKLRRVFRGTTLVLYITHTLKCVAAQLKHLLNMAFMFKIVLAGILIPAANDYCTLYLASAPYFVCG